MTKYPDLFAALAAPFRDNEVKVRNQAGRQLHYVTASTVANRLDEVLGPESWDFEIAPWGGEALIGTLIIHLPDGTTVRKSNVGGKAEMQSPDDDAKSAASDCLKRCAAILGVGRYLCRDGVPDFVRERTVGQQIESSRQLAQEPSRQPQPPPPSNGNGNYGPPRSGRGLFAAIKQLEQEHNVALLKYIDNWAKSQNYPFKMVDWDERQVAAGYAEVQRKLGQAESQEVAAGPGESDDIPFDRAAAREALESRVTDVAGKLFDVPTDRVTSDQIMSALGMLDTLVGSDLVVHDWNACNSRSSFAAYYRAALKSLKEYDSETLQAVLAS